MPSAASAIPAAPFLAVMAFGVLVAIAGHVARARWLVVVGLVLLFASTAAILVGAFVDYQGGGTDPRRPHDPREPTL
ncbi:MAG: hypothetical protein IRZ32_09070 [Solirubrobacteraceae bacterium]|nr:hypothetical protein [Solirubrobacteraceae bacterium]